MNYQLGIITINYYSEDLLGNFIDSLRSQSFDNWCLVVVNNGSNADIAELIKSKNDSRLFSIESGGNPGYASANNIGFDFLKEKNLINNKSFLCFSNPDIVLEDKDVIIKLISGMQKHKADFIGPKIINQDGSFMLPHLKPGNYLKTFFHLGNNGLADRVLGYNKKLKKMEEAVEVFMLNGSFFIAGFKAFEQAGGFDSNTFLYYEEEIFFRKAKESGLKAVYEPSVNVKHFNSATVHALLGSAGKKRTVYNSELYLIKNILKANAFLVFLFRLERKMEYWLIKLTGIFRKK